MADIDFLTSYNSRGAWVPVGQNFAGAYNALYATNTDKTATFLGTFDGGNHTISNIKIEGVGENTVTGFSSEEENNEQQVYSIGFFGYLQGTVKNLKIDQVTVIGYHYVGTIAGYADVGGNIENCHVTNATITCAHLTDTQCGDKAGGIIGMVGNENSVVKNCTVGGTTTIKAGRDAGQIAGCAREATVENCSVVTGSTVTVSGGLIADGVTRPTGSDHCATDNENITNDIIGRKI